MPSLDDLAPWLQFGGAGVVVAISAYAVRLITGVVLKAVEIRDGAASKEVDGWKAIADSERARADSLWAQLIELRKRNGVPDDG